LDSTRTLLKSKKQNNEKNRFCKRFAFSRSVQLGKREHDNHR
jgi:hypothetical protein